MEYKIIKESLIGLSTIHAEIKTLKEAKKLENEYKKMFPESIILILKSEVL